MLAAVNDRAVYALSERIVDEIDHRAVRAAELLSNAGVAYAIIGGKAVQQWVASVDPDATRSTKDVDVLVRRDRLPAVIAALEAGGFEYHNVNGIDLFVDGPDGSVRNGVHLVFAGEKTLRDNPVAAPALADRPPETDFEVIGLEDLVAMKLTSFRLKDRVHLIDLIDVGLVDATWVGRVPEPLRERLRQTLQDAEDER